MSDYALALAFDTDDPEFVRGVEVGRLWEQLKAGDADGQMFHATNAEMVMRMAESLDLDVRAEDVDETWMVLRDSASPTGGGT